MPLVSLERLLVLVAFISGTITAARPSEWNKRQSDTTSANPNDALPGWTFVGCFSDVNHGTVLIGQSFADETNMSPALCTAFCGGNSSTPFNFAGIEHGDQCFCDFSIQGIPIQVNETICNLPCTGDSTLVCGGELLLSVYQNTNEGVGPLPTHKATIGEFVFAGCLRDTDGTDIRTLSTPLSMEDLPDGVTAELCTSTCLERGFTMAGMEIGRECWCSNDIDVPLGLIIAPIEECSLACDADPTELCGAPKRLSMYTVPLPPPGEATQLTPVSPAATGVCVSVSSSASASTSVIAISSVSAATTAATTSSESSAPASSLSTGTTTVDTSSPTSTSASASASSATSIAPGTPTSGVPPHRPNFTSISSITTS
ncbi:WSC domain-containing protein [Psilocybe cubensis]|uniref:WSC domain-containing protein n=2 Tax=Psilocybe cubensis TaxID=181762 RepID=A0ACB8HA76_PSICU|nr:WSC domain-containing protein [Psilocybe cubensis]KAH9484915.1 WSC domain-containing protein [Psilocybe cubensis]